MTLVDCMLTASNAVLLRSTGWTPANAAVLVYTDVWLDSPSGLSALPAIMAVTSTTYRVLMFRPAILWLVDVVVRLAEVPKLASALFLQRTRYEVAPGTASQNTSISVVSGASPLSPASAEWVAPEASPDTRSLEAASRAVTFTV